MVDNTDGRSDEAESGPGESSTETAAKDPGEDSGEQSDDLAERSEPADPDQSTERVSGSRHAGPEPSVSLTIEGTYASVFERVEHPDSHRQSEVERVAENLESTLMAVNRTGGGIRSEIYDAVEFELDDPWEIRKYLELLEMHDLIRMQDDRWVPPDHAEHPERTGDSR